MSLSRILPKPSLSTYDPDVQQQYRKQQEQKQAQNSGTLVKSGPPPYGHRKGWVPRTQEDFGDGGAYPECIVVQYPMMMGSKKKGASQSNAVALQYDKDGSVKYDAILKQGHRDDKIIHSGVESTLYKQYNEADLQRPDEETIESTTESTRQALEKLVNSKISAALPVRAAPKQEPAQYIRFTPAQQGGGFNSGAKQRIIRMVEAQVDPMEPAKFNTSKKIPRGPPSPPVPVLHSPTRKLTAKEQQDWKIPPCVSNWKNAKGYTIPLDKRLAADGRGLQSVTINENFARLAEALFIADRKAREAVEMRAQVERKMATKEKEKQEKRLRDLAAKARMERAGISADGDEDGNDDDRGAINERNEIRDERRKDRARERNIARAAPDKQAQLRKDADRDVSEQIALGLPARGNQNDESMFDQRLFNKSQGLDSGFGFDDDTYNIFDKPFRNEANMANNIYRPSKNVDQDTYGDDLDKIRSSKRFVPDKDFSGGAAQSSRDGPVQFEMAPGAADEGGEEEDPFGLEKFLSEAKKGSATDGAGQSTSGSKRPKPESEKPSSSGSKRKR